MCVVVQFEVRNSKEKRIFTRFLSEENLCKTIRLSGGGGLYTPPVLIFHQRVKFLKLDESDMYLPSISSYNVLLKDSKAQSISL